MELIMELNIGLLETHGEVTTEKADLLGLLEESTTLLLSQIAHGLLQKIPGLKKKNILLLKLKRMIQETNQATQIFNQNQTCL